VDDAAIVIFGAAVRDGGRPSPALARRIAYGLLAAHGSEAPVVCSGAAGRYGPSEAFVMAQALKADGVAAARLVLDEESRDTLQSVIFAARFLRRRGLARCIVCSDGYHLPRIRLLLAALGVAAEAGPVQRGPVGSKRQWLRMVLREALATPYDLAIVLARRRGLMRQIGA
jgi:uncharacterized SAM-binding protein YcdF (DUF218 family)